MRVISGKHGGRHLVSFKADHIRPTTDRVKGSLFNKIAPYLEGAIVLDLFAGTGSLGIEALSRGARFVQFVDSNKKSIQILSENLELLKIDKNEGRVLQKDVLKFLHSYKDEGFDIILIDPPFTEKLSDSVLIALGKSKTIKDGTLVAIEFGTKEYRAEKYPRLELLSCAEYGDKSLILYKVLLEK